MPSKQISAEFPQQNLAERVSSKMTNENLGFGEMAAMQLSTFKQQELSNNPPKDT